MVGWILIEGGMFVVVGWCGVVGDDVVNGLEEVVGVGRGGWRRMEC